MNLRPAWKLVTAVLLSVAAYAGPVRAASPETAPAELLETLEQFQTAANEENIERLGQLISPEFSNNDGFTRDTLQTALQQLWEQYQVLDYRVELLSWESIEGGYEAETLTYVSGVQTIQERTLTLESVIRSQQRFVSGQLVSQEILSERNQVTAGQTPPTVTVILPESAPPSNNYDFDAIVLEPLRDRYLLGAVLEEGTTATDFFQPRPLELELLAAGGLFKVGETPAETDHRWVSALLIRDDGSVLITRRLRVEN